MCKDKKINRNLFRRNGNYLDFSPHEQMQADMMLWYELRRIDAKTNKHMKEVHIDE